MITPPTETRRAWRAWRETPDPLWIVPSCDLCDVHLGNGAWRVEFWDRERRLKSACGNWFSHANWWLCQRCYGDLETHLALMALEGAGHE